MLPILMLVLLVMVQAWVEVPPEVFAVEATNLRETARTDQCTAAALRLIAEKEPQRRELLCETVIFEPAYESRLPLLNTVRRLKERPSAYEVRFVTIYDANFWVEPPRRNRRGTPASDAAPDRFLIEWGEHVVRDIPPPFLMRQKGEKVPARILKERGFEHFYVGSSRDGRGICRGKHTLVAQGASLYWAFRFDHNVCYGVRHSTSHVVLNQPNGVRMMLAGEIRYPILEGDRAGAPVFAQKVERSPGPPPETSLNNRTTSHRLAGQGQVDTSHLKVALKYKKY
ncbi:MAG: hypothetical protein ACNA8W_01060 [Bradymonadaceae bacterium]